MTTDVLLKIAFTCLAGAGFFLLGALIAAVLTVWVRQNAKASWRASEPMRDAYQDR